MKDYSLIWIDDEVSNIDAIRSDVEENIRYLNYNPVISDYRTYDADLLTKISDPNINLIITDLNLLDGQNGSEVITMIRENSIWHDILLYSSHSKMLMSTIQGLDGIYYHAFTDFVGLTRKIDSVVQATITRDQYALIRNGD